MSGIVERIKDHWIVTVAGLVALPLTIYASLVTLGLAPEPALFESWAAANGTPASTATCAGLASALPQFPDAVRQTFGIAAIRDVRMVYDAAGCTNANGFVLGDGTPITFQVPAGGCIDSDDRATFSAATVPDGFGGRRAFTGRATVYAATYRAIC